MKPAADILIVIPAQAGTQGEIRAVTLGPRFRGDDNGWERSDEAISIELRTSLGIASLRSQ